MWAAIVNIMLGLWLMISPSLFPLEKAAADNHYITGPLVITFAIIAMWELNRPARYLTLLAGAWLVLSPFILGYEDAAATRITLSAGVLIGGCSLVKECIRGSYGGGWRSLFRKNRA
jgi:hypothetical protein